jgi:hypothetical protein
MTTQKNISGAISKPKKCTLTTLLSSEEEELDEEERDEERWRFLPP